MGAVVVAGDMAEGRASARTESRAHARPPPTRRRRQHGRRQEARVSLQTQLESKPRVGDRVLHTCLCLVCLQPQSQRGSPRLISIGVLSPHSLGLPTLIRPLLECHPLTACCSWRSPRPRARPLYHARPGRCRAARSVWPPSPLRLRAPPTAPTSHPVMLRVLPLAGCAMATASAPPRVRWTTAESTTSTRPSQPIRTHPLPLLRSRRRRRRRQLHIHPHNARLACWRAGWAACARSSPPSAPPIPTSRAATSCRSGGSAKRTASAAPLKGWTTAAWVAGTCTRSSCRAKTRSRRGHRRRPRHRRRPLRHRHRRCRWPRRRSRRRRPCRRLPPPRRPQRAQRDWCRTAPRRQRAAGGTISRRSRRCCPS